MQLAGQRIGTFHFMRHGRTALNAQGLICGRLDPPLDANGEEEARRAARWLAPLAFSRVVVSPALRARQTASLALPGVEQFVMNGFAERDWGELEGLPLSRQCGYLDTPPGGEPWQDFVTRVTEALQQLPLTQPAPLIVAHSGVWRVLRALATGSPDGGRLVNAWPVEVHPGHVDTPWRVRALDGTAGADF